VFQNNFLLPKASPNAGMLKTFYNSKQSTSNGPQQMTGNVYQNNNGTKRAIQGMKMHI